MAKQINFHTLLNPDTRTHRDDFTAVRLATTRADWAVMWAWMNDVTRPGIWGYDHYNSSFDGVSYWVFYISHPDVAAEFKIRFG